MKQNLQMILAGLFVFCMLISNLHAADDVSYGFKKRVLKDETGEHKYVVYIPMGYDPNKKSPVILYLHGGGEPRDRWRQTCLRRNWQSDPEALQRLSLHHGLPSV